MGIIRYFLGCSLLYSCTLLDATSPPPQKSQAPSSFESIQQKKGPTPPIPPTPPASQKAPIAPGQQAPLVPLNPSTIYAEPGIATLQGGQWVGTEHLYNLSSSIGVLVEIIKPAGLEIPSTSDEVIKEKIAGIFKTGRITVRVPIMKERTPLPFFQMIIIIQPIEKGYVIYCVGRLFEEVPMKRVQLPLDIVWQAITWERQELRVLPADQIKQQVEEAVQVIAGAFVERFNTYPPSKT